MTGLPFVPGLALSRQFFDAVVRPELARSFTRLPYAAALLGAGSEVLGQDTGRSTDHDWGPRVLVFLRHDDVASVGERMRAALSSCLPTSFLGWPVITDPQHSRRTAIEVMSWPDWCERQLGFDASSDVTVFDWLATPTQLLAETVGGAVFHDDIGSVSSTRARLEWYPDDLWRYVLACQWQRIAEEEAFVGRCAEVGDDGGSRIVTARLVRDLLRLSLLLQRQYPPYMKWLGSRFAATPGAASVGPALDGALRAETWPQREAHLVAALRESAVRCNELQLTSPVEPSTRPFHDRPFEVLGADRFAAALRGSITDPLIARLPLIGGIDQFVDSTAVLTEPLAARAIQRAALPELS